MSVERALADRLLAHAGLTALVGTRVHGGQRPQGDTYPSVHYTTRPNHEPRTFGTGAGDPYETVATITARHQVYETAKSVAAQVRAALSGWTAASVHGLEVQGVTLGDEEDDYNESLELHEVAVDAVIWTRTL